MNNTSTNLSKEQAIYIKKLKANHRLVVISRWTLLILIIGIWEIAANLKWIDPFIFSSPSRVFSTFIEMMSDGSLLYHIGITLWETFIGFSLGTSLGLIIAILLWWNKTANKVLEPYLVVLNSLPKTALAPILIVWFGNNMKSIIITSIMLSIVITILNLLNGFLEVDEDKTKLIYSLGGTKLNVLNKVILPSNIPTLISTLKVNIGLSLVGVIIGEFLVAQAGLGYLIVYGSQIFRLDWVMLSIIILGILAAVLYKIIVVAEKKLNKKFL